MGASNRLVNVLTAFACTCGPEMTCEGIGARMARIGPVKPRCFLAPGALLNRPDYGQTGTIVQVRVLPRQKGRSPMQQKRRSANSHPATNQEWIDSGCRLATLWLDCFLVSFRGEFVGHGFLELFSIDAIAFGGVHENVVTAPGGSLIRRIEQADFQNQLAKFGLIIRAYLLGQKFLCGRRVLLRLYLVPLRQSRDLAVGEMTDQVVGNRQQVSLL